MSKKLDRHERRELDVTDQIHGKYAAEALMLFQQYSVRVCHWRSNITGLAWVGHPDRPIEGPLPKSELSFAVLAHEVGHHHIGKRRPRWREELLAWEFACDAMSVLGVPVTERVLARYAASMRYALAKALRRGLKEIPPELEQFL